MYFVMLDFNGKNKPTYDGNRRRYRYVCRTR